MSRRIAVATATLLIGLVAGCAEVEEPAGAYQCFIQDGASGDVLSVWDMEISQLTSCGALSPCLFMTDGPTQLTLANGNEAPLVIGGLSEQFDPDSGRAGFRAFRASTTCLKGHPCGAGISNEGVVQLTFTDGSATGNVFTTHRYRTSETLEINFQFDLECVQRRLGSVLVQ